MWRNGKSMAALCCAAAALAGCGAGARTGTSTRTPGRPARSSLLAAAGTGASAGGGRAARAPGGSAAKAAGGRGVEVADPQEANSFPAPASVHHAHADTPSKAGELAIAAGAQSDAEVEAELRQMRAVERSARETQQKRFSAVPGGSSIGGNGTIPIPSGVPEAVQRVVAGANAIADFPYVFGGGHASFVDNAYDCSGSVGYALAAGGMLSAPETSGELEHWGAPGPGRYITVYANAGHTYMYVDGMLYDTAGRSGVFASRWLLGAVDNSGFVARHWPGL